MNNKWILIIFNIFLVASIVFSSGFEYKTLESSSALCPRESGLYKDLIKNTDAVSKQYAVSLSGSASSFSTVFPNNFILAPGESKEIYSYATPKTETQPGNYDLKINFASGSDVNLISHIVVVKDCYGLIFAVDSSKVSVCPNEISRFELTLKNNGEYSETYNLEVAGPLSDRVSLSDKQVILNKGEIKKIIAFVNTPADSGEFGFSVNVDTASKRAKASLPLFVDVKPCFDFGFSVRSEKTSYEVCDRTVTQVQFKIENKGTTRNEFDLEVEGPVWARLSRNSLGLLPNEVRFVDMYIAPDFGVSGDYKIKINLVPKKGNLRASSNLDVKVNKCSGVDLQVNSKNIKACKGVANDFEVKVVNTGELEKTFQAALDGPEWITFNSVPQFNLKSGAERTLIIRAQPKEDLSEENYKLKIGVKAGDESSVIAHDEEELNLEVVGINECYKPSLSSEYTNAVIYYDSNVPIPVTITNNGNRRADYSLFLTGNAANFVRLSPSTLKLDAGKSDTVLLYVAPDVNTELGKYNAILTLNLLNGPMLESKEFNFEITGTKEKSLTLNLENNTTAESPVAKAKNYFFKAKEFAINNKMPVIAGALILLLVILILVFGWYKPVFEFFDDEEIEEFKEKSSKKSKKLDENNEEE